MEEVVVFVVAVVAILIVWLGLRRIFGAIGRARDDAWRRKHLHDKPVERKRDVVLPPEIPRAHVVPPKRSS